MYLTRRQKESVALTFSASQLKEKRKKKKKNLYKTKESYRSAVRLTLWSLTHPLCQAEGFQRQVNVGHTEQTQWQGSLVSFCCVLPLLQLCKDKRVEDHRCVNRRIMWTPQGVKPLIHKTEHAQDTGERQRESYLTRWKMSRSNVL